MTHPPTSDGDPCCPETPVNPADRTGPISSPSTATSAPAGSISAFDRSPAATAPPKDARTTLAVRRVGFDTIDASVWDALVDAAPKATPFSRHCVEDAWWSAYGPTAHDQTLQVTDPDGRLVAVAPLMHRHELEPTDVAARTSLRRASPPDTAVPESATAVFFGASYHADYATILSPADALPSVAEAVVAALADPSAPEWDVVDLRRLRHGDPAIDALQAAFQRRCKSERWHVTREREDVCPVLTLPDDGDFEAYLGSLGKKTRHEIRRKIRRAESAGPIELTPSPDPIADLDAFVDLHQKRWGADGLFPDNEGGQASRRFFAGLLADCSEFVELSFLTVAGKRVAAGVTFDDGETVYYYNAGVDPEARDLSPGVLMVAQYIRRAMGLKRRRIDFLRGDEPYKYDWGAVDEPIERLLVERIDGAVHQERGDGR